MHKMFFFFSHVSWYIVDEISCNISNITDIVYSDIIIIKYCHIIDSWVTHIVPPLNLHMWCRAAHRMLMNSELDLSD